MIKRYYLTVIITLLMSYITIGQESCETALDLTFPIGDSTLIEEGSVGFDDSQWYSITGDGSAFSIQLVSDYNTSMYVYTNDNCESLDDFIGDTGLSVFYTQTDSVYLIEIVSEPVPVNFKLTVNRGVYIDTSLVLTECTNAELLSFPESSNSLKTTGTLFFDLADNVEAANEEDFTTKFVEFYKVIGDGSVYGVSSEDVFVLVDTEECLPTLDGEGDELKFRTFPTEVDSVYYIAVVQPGRNQFVPYELTIERSFEYSTLSPRELHYINEPYFISTSTLDIDHQYLDLEDDSCGNNFLEFTHQAAILSYSFIGDGERWYIETDFPGTNFPTYIWLYEELTDGSLVCKEEISGFGDSEFISYEPKFYSRFDSELGHKYVFIIGGFDGEEGNVNFTVTNGDGLFLSPVEYCPVGTRRNTFEWIADVSVNDDLEHSNGRDAGGYGDFTEEEDILYLDTSDVVDIVLTPGYRRRAYTEYWRVWADWNYDGDFDDAGEMVFQASGKHTQTGTFTVPNEVEPYDLRLRVTMKWKGYSPSGCASYTNGEIQDYTMRVFGAGGSFPDDFGPEGPGDGFFPPVRLSESIDDGSYFEISDIFPNPIQASESLNIFVRASEQKTQTVLITNILGQVIQDQSFLFEEGENDLQMDIPNLQAGVYFVNVNGMQDAVKFIVMD